LAQNIELARERPEIAYMLNRLGSFARVVHFDKRGTGASDRTVSVPTLDQRVDDTRAVMDAAGVERAVMLGVSEGGPMALLFAVTYPERVSALVLQAASPCIDGFDASSDAIAARRAQQAHFAACWGTPQSVTLERFAPSIAHDPSYIEWEQRYERQSATPTAISDLLDMINDVDVTEVLPHISVPTLVVHRTGDRVVPIEHARAMAAAIPGARLAEFEGVDHFVYVGDVDGWLDAVQEFVTGVRPPPPTARRGRSLVSPVLRTFGGFGVERDGHEVPLNAWGSRRARQLCKRLAAAAGAPIAREELMDMLWPDQGRDVRRLGARLSVLLSTVRRILGGGVIADRACVRLDVNKVQLDLTMFDAAIAGRDHAAAVQCYRGPFLPEDLYEEWATPVRDRTRAAFAASCHHLAGTESRAGHHEQALQLALRLLENDGYDEPAHHAAIDAYVALDRPGEARRAHADYTTRMTEISAPAQPYSDIIGALPARSHDDRAK
jgi:pimeloyl-ACP methyl ester carboxylesterase/DNA-binding SARP family transcriptional activator